MKKILLSAFILLMTLQNTQAQLKSTIQKVTVFLGDGAQITRTAIAELPSGNTTLRFSHLSPFIKSNSIHVEASNAMLLSVNKQENFMTHSNIRQEITTLENEKKAWEDSLEQEKILLHVVKKDIELLLSYKDAIKNTEVIKVAELKELSNYQNTQMKSYLAKKVVQEKKIKIIREKLENIQSQLTSMGHNAQRPSHEIEITLHNPTPNKVKSNIMLEYVVARAKWIPSYNIRVEDINHPIKIEQIASVQQKTEEDWENVELTLSAANPNTSGILPELSPYYIIDREVVTSAVSSFMSSKPQLLRSAAANSAVALAENMPLPLAYQSVQHPTFTNIVIQTPYTITSDNTERKIDINALELRASYQYMSIPKINPQVFLTARTIDWEQYELLPGEANIFFGKSFVGTTFIDTRKIYDTFSVSLGVDKNIIIQRNRVKDFSSNKKFLSDKKLVNKQWEINIKNNKSNPIDVKVYDQIPISKSKDIKVYFDATKDLTPNASVQANTGEIEWIVKELSPKAQQTLSVSYAVEFPKHMNVVVE